MSDLKRMHLGKGSFKSKTGQLTQTQNYAAWPSFALSKEQDAAKWIPILCETDESL